MASPGAGGAGRPGWVAALVQAAYRLPWSYRDELLRLGIVPALLSFAIEMMDTLLMGKDILAMVVVVLADMVPLTIFQVAVYRLLLLGPGAVTPGIMPAWGRRELRFLGLNLAIGLVFVVIVLVLLLLLGEASLNNGPVVMLGLGVALLASYAYSRVSVAFPAIAVDHPLRLADAARCTAPVGGRLWLALILSAMPAVTVMLIVSEFLQVSQLAAAAPLATTFVVVALSYAATAVMLVPVALTFRELAGWSGPPAPINPGR
jgi:hypothetical protein